VESPYGVRGSEIPLGKHGQTQIIEKMAQGAGRKAQGKKNPNYKHQISSTNVQNHK
jgi:hypothetical protein